MKGKLAFLSASLAKGMSVGQSLGVALLVRRVVALPAKTAQRPLVRIVVLAWLAVRVCCVTIALYNVEYTC